MLYKRDDGTYLSVHVMLLAIFVIVASISVVALVPRGPLSTVVATRPPVAPAISSNLTSVSEFGNLSLGSLPLGARIAVSRTQAVSIARTMAPIGAAGSVLRLRLGVITSARVKLRGVSNTGPNVRGATMVWVVALSHARIVSFGPGPSAIGTWIVVVNALTGRIVDTFNYSPS